MINSVFTSCRQRFTPTLAVDTEHKHSTAQHTLKSLTAHRSPLTAHRSRLTPSHTNTHHVISGAQRFIPCDYTSRSSMVLVSGIYFHSSCVKPMVKKIKLKKNEKTHTRLDKETKKWLLIIRKSGWPLPIGGGNRKRSVPLVPDIRTRNQLPSCVRACARKEVERLNPNLVLEIF